MQVQVEIKGVEQIVRALERFAQKGENVSEVLEEAVGRPIYNATRKAFDTKTSPFGQRWQELKTSTLKAKKGKGSILIRKGKLNESLDYTVMGSKLFVGVNAQRKGFQYGLTHQFGSKKVPARPFLPIDKDGNMPDLIVRQIERNLLEWFRDE